MHNIIKKLTAIIIVSVMFSGCSGNKADVKLITNEYETDTEIVHMEIPQITGIADKDFEEKINAEYEEYSSSLLNTFLSDSQRSANERNGKSKLEVKQKVTYNKNGILSIAGEMFEYTEGVNGSSIRRIVNIDTKNGKILLLKDLFSDDQYIQMLNARLEEMSEDAMYSDLWEKPVITDAQNEFFFFSDEGLVIFYPPYELSYYARGFVDFVIPYSELYGYLKPEYSVLYR